MAAEVRAHVVPDRQVHLVLENDDNAACHLARRFRRAMERRRSSRVARLLTGEHRGLLSRTTPTTGRAAGALPEGGFVYQGEPSPHRGGKPRGTPSADLPPTAFVLFLQNHDQIGNRAFGERLTSWPSRGAGGRHRVAALCPQIPLMFMGEETASEAPFLFFTDHNEELARAVREGRRREFASFPQFSDPELCRSFPTERAQKPSDAHSLVAHSAARAKAGTTLQHIC